MDVSFFIISMSKEELLNEGHEFERKVEALLEELGEWLAKLEGASNTPFLIQMLFSLNHAKLSFFAFQRFRRIN